MKEHANPTTKSGVLAVLHFRNAALVELAKTNPYGSLKMLLLAAGVHRNEFYAWRLFRQSPYFRTGELKPSAQRLLDCSDSTAAELFPPELYALQFPRSIAKHYTPERFVALAEARSVPAAEPWGLPSSDQTTAFLEEVLRLCLTPRQEAVLRARLGWDGPPQSLEKLAERFACSRANILCIEKSALARLRSSATREFIVTAGKSDFATRKLLRAFNPRSDNPRFPARPAVPPPAAREER